MANINETISEVAKLNPELADSEICKRPFVWFGF